MPFDTDTLDEKMNHLVAEMDRAYGSIRKIHLDPSHLNWTSPDARTAQEIFAKIQERIWQLKNAWNG
jgi:hypothetical protein